MLQTALFTPVGMVNGWLNTGGQLACDFITGAQPSEDSTMMLGCHWWGLPGLLGGCKTVLEMSHAQIEENTGEFLGSSTVRARSTFSLFFHRGPQSARPAAVRSHACAHRSLTLRLALLTVADHDGVHRALCPPGRHQA